MCGGHGGVWVVASVEHEVVVERGLSGRDGYSEGWVELKKTNVSFGWGGEEIPLDVRDKER
jgi:hypothetical protein